MSHPQTLYTSMMFHKDNLNSKKLISIYKQIENALNEDKSKNNNKKKMGLSSALKD